MAVEGAASDRGKADPNVVLPPAVKSAGQRSEELQRQVIAAKAAKPAGADDPVQVAQPRSNTPSVVTTNFDPNNPQPPGESSLPVPQSSQQVPQQPLSSDDWEHRVRSVQGRYDRAEAENRRLAGQINDMQRLMASMGSMGSPQPQGTVQPPAQSNNTGSGVRFSDPVSGAGRFQRRVSEKEVSDYGSDLIDVMGRRAQEVVEAIIEPRLASLQNENAMLQRRLGGIQQTVAFDGQSRLYQALDANIPNWRQINESPEFVRWLQMPEPLSGQIRHAMLDEAFKTQQTQRVLDFFVHFLRDMGVELTAPAPANGAGRANGNGAAQVDLTAFAAPGRAKSGQTQVSPGKPVVYAHEISAFYDQAARGVYVGREQEYNMIQKQIEEAVREGRVKR